MKFTEIPCHWIKISENIWYEPFKSFDKRKGKVYTFKRFVYKKKCFYCGNSAFMYSKKRKFCSPKCSNKSNKTFGEKHPTWNNYQRCQRDGYAHIKINHGPWIREHRYFMEKHIKRKLKRNEHVHHVNGIKTDNRIENLQLMTDKEHGHIHGKHNHISYASFVKSKSTI